MPDWYRNETWSDAIAEEFERRLSRSRHQKSQHLSLQGYHLLGTRPDVAQGLLRRAGAFDDAEAPRALAFLALACLALGDVEGALAAYEDAMERQLARPNVIAVQPADYLFVVGMFAREDRLATALPIADAVVDDGPFGADPQAEAAKALVYAMAGREVDARHHAAKALPLLADMPIVSAMGIAIADLRERLEAIATGG